MPQISPANWLLMFSFFLSCFILFSVVLYFNLPTLSNNNNNFKKSIQTPSLNWKW